MIPAVMLRNGARVWPFGPYGPYRARPVFGSTWVWLPPKVRSGSEMTPESKFGTRAGRRMCSGNRLLKQSPPLLPHQYLRRLQCLLDRGLRLTLPPTQYRQVRPPLQQ